MLVYNQAIEPALFRRAAWVKAGGYCESFSSSGIEDWDLWITFLESGCRAEVLPEIVWDYRIRADQMSTRMYQPEIWEQLCRELLLRHEKTYQKYLVSVVGKYGSRWAEIRDWANEREQARRWWERQSCDWQHVAEERERVIQEQQSWIAELEKARAWQEEQRIYWQRLAEERERMVQEQQT
jgi:hypothetical protein